MIGLEILQSAVDYIEEHLLDAISYEDVAYYIHMSPYEFHRTFSFIAGITVNTYIRNRRLSLAGQELLQTDCKIIDLAVKYGFDSSDGFSKAFSRFHGVSPSIAKEKGSSLIMYNPLSIRISLEGGRKINYRIKKEYKRKFIAITQTFPVDIINEDENEDISTFWSETYKQGLADILKCSRDTEDNRIFGLCAPLSKNASYFDYGIGILIKDENRLKKVLNQINNQAANQKFAPIKVWEVDEQDYVVFECYGTNGDCISQAWTTFYKEFLPQSGYKSSEKTDYEIYFDHAPNGLFCELWIPIEKDGQCDVL